ncbi:hypothetical protein [Pararobbsia alpina]|uniref:Uncharacterized protein n=1 Tax=Pararobbsia alpina TaxID=621374 RepID=A0A6S7CPD2_9BURK|nr:hypothetical protein [Pararobbsia alpina]CAB3784549.1 hypothetical protein LMG28138_01831 [Pararobbsia alpina]
MAQSRISEELVFQVFRQFSKMADEDMSPAEALLALAEMLTRAHPTMDPDDWETIAYVGGLLWRAEMKEAESSAQMLELLRRARGQ